METPPISSDDIQAALRRLAAANVTPEAIGSVQLLAGSPEAIVAWAGLLRHVRPADLCVLQGKSASVISRQVALLLNDGRLHRHRIKVGTVGRPADVLTLPDGMPPTIETLRSLDDLVRDIILVRTELLFGSLVMTVPDENGAFEANAEHTEDAERAAPLLPPWQSADLLNVIPDAGPSADDADDAPTVKMPSAQSLPWQTAGWLNSSFCEEQSTHISSLTTVAPLPPGDECGEPGPSVPIQTAIKLAKPRPPALRAILWKGLRQGYRKIRDVLWAFAEHIAVFEDWIGPLVILIILIGSLRIALSLGLDQIILSAVADGIAPPAALTPEPQLTPSPIRCLHARVAGTGSTGLIVRAAAGGKRVGKLAEHTQVEIIGGPLTIKDHPHHTWWHVRDGRLAGWVSATFLAFDSNCP